MLFLLLSVQIQRQNSQLRVRAVSSFGILNQLPLQPGKHGVFKTCAYRKNNARKSEKKHILLQDNEEKSSTIEN